MNRVEFHGGLRLAYGEGFDLDVLTPAEMFRALYVQLPGFLRHATIGEYLICREMPDGELAMDEHLMEIRMSNTTFHFVPIVEGSAKKGIGKMIFGAVLIGASFFIPGGMAIAGLAIKTLALTVGLGLLLGGAAMLLAPNPKLDKDREKDTSFLFSGDINPAAQGMAVPLTYGRDRVRPIPIATQVKTNEYHIGVGGTIGGGGDVGGGNVGGGSGGGAYNEQTREVEWVDESYRLPGAGD